jgi:hypothetical protein
VNGEIPIKIVVQEFQRKEDPVSAVNRAVSSPVKEAEGRGGLIEVRLTACEGHVVMALESSRGCIEGVSSIPGMYGVDIIMGAVVLVMCVMT